MRNRSKLLAAAEKVFAERGIEGASLDTVAAEAGLTKGAVYSNFANKEELILQVMWKRQGGPAKAEAERLFASGRTAEQLVADYGAFAAAVLRGGERDHYARVILEFYIHAVRHPAIRERLLALMFPPHEGADRHPLAPPGSELDKLSFEHASAILTALDIGLVTLYLLDPQRFPPELYAVALRLVAGMEVDEAQVPREAKPEPAPGEAS